MSERIPDEACQETNDRTIRNAEENQYGNCRASGDTTRREEGKEICCPRQRAVKRRADGAIHNLACAKLPSSLVIHCRIVLHHRSFVHFFSPFQILDKELTHS